MIKYLKSNQLKLKIYVIDYKTIYSCLQIKTQRTLIRIKLRAIRHLVIRQLHVPPVKKSSVSAANLAVVLILVGRSEIIKFLRIRIKLIFILY